MKHSNVPYVVLLPLVLFVTTNLHTAAETYLAMQPAKTAPLFFAQRHSEEGFAAGTLIRTPGGYQPIETITEHNIVLDDYAQPKRVLKVIRRVAQQCVRIIINGQTICMGYEQAVCLPYNIEWIIAGDVQEQEYLLSADGYMLCINRCELIPETTVLYQLSVEDHIFCVGSENLIVHNADIATASAAMLCLEYVAYAHPVTVLVGCTLALSTIARQAYKSWRESRQHEGTNDTTDEVVPQEIFLTERYYYEQRKKELTTLRDEFEGIYRGIIAMKELFHPNAVTFSSQFLQGNLQQHTQSNVLRISIADELKLSDDRKTALRNAREQEFALLEKEISELHALLVVHFNELMNQVHDAYDACIKYTTEVQKGIALWNNNKDALTDQIASQSYEKEIMQECFLHNVQQKIAELKVIIAYYRQHKQLSSLQHSTNIFELLDYAEQSIKEIEQWVKEQLAHVHTIMRVSEQYFARRGIPTALFKNQIKNAFYKEQSNRNIQALKSAQNKLSDMNNNNGGPNEPKKPRNDDDKKGDDPRSQGKRLRHNPNPGQRGHHFRKGGGHIEEFTSEAERILNKAFEEGTCHGVNKSGRWTYTWTNPTDGNQIWIEVMNDGTVSNCGANVVHWIWNAVKGTLEKPAGFVQPARGVIYK